MIYGRPPFASLSTIQKFQSISSENYKIDYPAVQDSAAVLTIQSCLQRDPKFRASIRGSKGLLSNSFLTLRDESKTDNFERCDQNTILEPIISNQLIVSSIENVSSNKEKLFKVGREPLKPISTNLMNQIHSIPQVEISKPIVSMSKWIKPKCDTPEKHDFRSVLERRFVEIRKFLDTDINSPAKSEDNFDSSSVF